MDPRQTTPPRDPFRNRTPRTPREPEAYEPPPRFEEPYRDDYGAPPPRGRSRGFDLAGLFVLLDAIRRAVPGELEERVTGLIREFLLTLRSLIDWYLERLDNPRREPQVEDIPID